MQYNDHEAQDNINYRNQKGRIRLQTSQLFLTYPRCPIDKDKILTAIKKVPGIQDNINLHLVAQELIATLQMNLVTAIVIEVVRKPSILTSINT